MSRKRKALWVGLVLLVAAIPAYFWLFTESTVPGTGSFTIDLVKVRALASSLPGEKPAEIRFEEIGSLGVPSMGIVAGSGWSGTKLTFYAYQLRYPDHLALLDTGMDRKTAESTGVKDFHEDAFARVTAAMAVADPILVTHEHYDHLGGLATTANLKALMPHVKLTKEQLAFPKKLKPVVFPPEALEGYVPLDYDQLAAVAPGVVFIKSPGHTPGSQIVYVQRADGTEYLFLGDVAWHWQNVEEVRTRARLATLLIGEDRDGVLLQLQELHRLAAAEPKLKIIPGHDKPIIEGLTAGGFLKAGF
jgi:glyoxylase-like metal-dependent hydrolase (beta-lactamase superfamily II)